MTPAPLALEATEPPTTTTQQEPVSDEAREFFTLLRERRARGWLCRRRDGSNVLYPPLPADDLVFDCRLWKAAAMHSEDMAARDYLDHYTKGTTQSFWQRAHDQGTSARGEVIAKSTTASGGKVLEQWLTSREGYCEGIMDPRNKRFGAEVNSDGNGIWQYWTGVFAHDMDGDTPQDCLA